MLALFELDQSYTSLSHEDMIRFRTFRQYHSISLMQFLLSLGLYDDDFIHNKEYTQLLTDYPPVVIP